MKKDLSALIKSSEELVRQEFSSVEQIVKFAYKNLSDVMDTDNMYIALYDDKLETISFPLIYKDGSPWEEMWNTARTISENRIGRTEQIIFSKEPLLIKSRHESIYWHNQKNRVELVGDPIASWLGVPMFYLDRVLGVIAVYNSDTDNAFDAEDVKIMQIFANFIAIAVKNLASKEYQHYLEKELSHHINSKDKAIKDSNNYNYEEVNYQINKSIFISYAHEDGEYALKLSNDLKSYGLKVWIDKESLKPGQLWRETILDSIQTSHYFIALLSSISANKIGFVQREINEALEIRKNFAPGIVYIIPVYLEECSVQHRELKAFHRVDMFPDWEIGLKSLLKVFEE